MQRPPAAHAFTRGTVALRAWEWPGDAPPTLLLHGIGNYARYWDFFADAVAGRLRLIATDARGHGESGRPPGDYAPQEFDFSELLGTVESVHQVPLEDRMPDTLQHALKPESVDQLTVWLDDGRAVIVQQEELQRFARGQRVRLVGSANGVRIEHE